MFNSWELKEFSILLLWTIDLVKLKNKILNGNSWKIVSWHFHMEWSQCTDKHDWFQASSNIKKAEIKSSIKPNLSFLERRCLIFLSRFVTIIWFFNIILLHCCVILQQKFYVIPTTEANLPKKSDLRTRQHNVNIL